MSEDDENSSEISSSESDEDLVQDIPDKDFFKTLSYLKNKDPRIYDNEVKFFSEQSLAVKGKTKCDLAGNTGQPSDDKRNVPDSINENNAKTNKFPKSKFSLKDLDNESSSEDELMALKKSSNGTQKIENEVENEYVQFLKGRKTILEDKEVEQELKPLQNYWNKEILDENEQFLRDYILNKKYLAPDSEVNIENEDLSEDERELEEQDEYEANYNFRFETGENLQLKRFPRNIEGSMRRKNDARSKKRSELAQRKKEEKAKKFQDVKKKQKQKLSEIEGRLQKLKELTGNVELGFKDEEILEDFDPEKHDQKMNELFNEEYYNNEESEHPVFNEDDDYWENDIEMDCEDVHKSKKLTRSQKKKLRKKKTYKDIIDIAKPSFDPKVHSDFKKYIDEYYSLDCEDFIDDIPCKFKYREVVPNDYGLSIEEILMAEDSELNRWASVIKICKRRPEHVEKNEVNIYKKKAGDEALKKKILSSLYSEPQDMSNDEVNDKDNSKNSRRKDSEKLLEREEMQVLIDDCQSAEINHTSKKNVILSGNSHQITPSFHHNDKKKRKHKKDKSEDYSNARQILGNSVDSANPTHKNKKKKAMSLDGNLSTLNTTSDENVCEGEIKEFKEHNGDCGDEHKTSVELQNSTSNSQKKKRRKKKKKNASGGNTSGEHLSNDNSQIKSIQEPNNSQNETKLSTNTTFKKNKRKVENVNFKNKSKNKLGFKKKKNNLINLSDSRLQAYGIKPKKFRAKMQYSQNNRTS